MGSHAAPIGWPKAATMCKSKPLSHSKSKPLSHSTCLFYMGPKSMVWAPNQWWWPQALSLGGGGSIQPSGCTPPSPQKGLSRRAPKNPTEIDPRALEVTRTQIRQKMKMGFLESACQGGSEKSSFAMSLVKKNGPFSMLKKTSALLAPELINGPAIGALFPNLPPVLGATINPPPPPPPELKTRLPWGG